MIFSAKASIFGADTALMKLGYLPVTLFCLSLAAALQAAPWRGYIVTKDQKKLTGYVAEVYQTTSESVVVFINDFGTTYFIQAELIRGFVYQTEEGYITYVSLPIRQSSRFMRVVEQGSLSLFLAPELRLRTSFNQGLLYAEQYVLTEYWLLSPDKHPLRLRRTAYKRKVQRLLQRNAPELAGKIGQEGYKFNDLPAIIKEYNQLTAPKGWTL